MFAVMWSEHCGYKYSRPVLAHFKRYKESLEGAGFENAGWVDIGDGLAATMKIESHNHPSAVEPYQGAATGVGGIIRDIFTMGARPIASLNSLWFGPIREGEADSSVIQRNRYLFEHVVAGIAGYGNCVGVPTVGCQIGFHRRYSANPLVNAMAVGIVESDAIATAAAGGNGNPVVYLGSATGKDGIHGATFASDALGEDSNAKRPNVQIGDPFAEKLLIESTLEAVKTGAVVGIQDMGAAGLTCSTVEMCSKGGVGMDIDLDLVPTREQGMSAYEMMLSESQERMLAVVEERRAGEVIEIFERWGVHAVVIGKVTEDSMVTIRRGGQIEASLNPTWLTDECPTYRTEAVEPEYYRRAKQFDVSALKEVEPEEALLQLLNSPNIGSKRWVYEQYDQHVQTQTTLSSGEGDAAVLAPRGTSKGIAFNIDGNSRQVYLDPYVGGMLAVAEAARNVACVGAVPRAVTDGLNFGNPRLPQVYWQFAQAVRGIADAAEAMETPVISGNVSFYNESDLGEVLPTPLIGMLGILEHADRRIGMGISSGHKIGLISYETPPDGQQGLGASEYLAEIHRVEDGSPIRPDLSKERALCELLAELAEEGLITCAHDCSEGGAAVALAEMAIVGGAGISAGIRGGERIDSALFGETPGRVYVGFPESQAVDIEQLAIQNGLIFQPIGDSNDSNLLRISVGDRMCISLSLEQLTNAYETALSYGD